MYTEIQEVHMHVSKYIKILKKKKRIYLVLTVVCALFFILCSTYYYCIMSQIKGALELSKFW